MPPKKGAELREPLTNVEDLRSTIAGGGVAARGYALTDLILFLQKTSSTPGVIKRNKEYHGLLEALFRSALMDKQKALNEKTGASTARKRASQCAEALRDTVKHGLTRLKRKTVRAVVDHVTQILSNRKGEFFEPLAQDYIQALVVLLSYPVHVEGLAAIEGSQGWYDCVDFCVDNISRLLENADQDTAFISRDSPGPGTGTHSTARSGRSSTQRGATQIQQSKDVQPLVQCLLSLVSAANAPLLDRRQEVSNAVVRVLQLKVSLSLLHKVAFATLNCILSSTSGDDPALGRTLTRELVPLLGHWWQPRSLNQDDMLLSVRDEMLKMIHGLHLYLDSLAQDDSDGLVLRDIESLVETLWTEYSLRDPRTRLQLDDLTFSATPLPSEYFTTDLFGLRPFNMAAERRWALVDVIALLEEIFLRYSRRRLQRPTTEEEQPRKKRRMAGDSHRIHQKMLSLESGVKLTAIQLLPFFLPRCAATAEDVSNTIDDLMPLISAKQGMLSSWAMIACASCTIQAYEGKWQQIWQLAVRSVSIPSTCRAACVLLHAILQAQLLPYHEISDDVNNIVTMADICGPAILVDSSLILMHRLTHLRNSLVPSASQVTSSHIIRWVFTTWKPAELVQATSDSVHTFPIDLVNLIRTCCGLPNFEPSTHIDMFGGPISQSWVYFNEMVPMMRYLLLLDETTGTGSHRDNSSQSSATETAADSADNSSFQISRTLVVDLLSPKLEELLQILEPASQSTLRRGSEGMMHLSTERLQSMVTCLITGTILLPHLESLDSQISRDVGTLLPDLWDKVIRVIFGSSETQNFLNSVLVSIAPYIPGADATRLEVFCKNNPNLLEVFSKLSDAADEKVSQYSSAHDPDLMELDDNFASQNSQLSSVLKSSTFPRQSLALDTSTDAFYQSTRMRLNLLSEYFKDVGQIGLIPETLVETLISLTPEQFLSCRRFIREILDSDLGNISNYASKIVERVGEILSADELETCEVALCTCVGILVGFAPAWSSDRGDLAQLVGDLYDHLFKVALPNIMLSPQAQISVAGLLYRLLEINSQFHTTLNNMPSPRTSLLSILQGGTMRVKFYVGPRLPKIFELWVLSEHEGIFVDILASLPRDSAVVEGIALRIFVLAELACKCPTLLRRAVFHTVETAGRVLESAQYATRCLATIAKARSLKSPKELFRLFAPQLLYTWLNPNPPADIQVTPIEDFPYGIFGFTSLDELLEQAQTEAAALMIMRLQETEFNELATRLKSKSIDMIRQGFSKIMAYTISYDLSTSKEAPGETRVRKIMGKERFLEAIYTNFADIIAIFFDLMDQEDPVQDWWRKDRSLVYAAERMDKIKEISHYPVNLPPNQQPMFRGKYLTRQITHLVRWTNYEMSSLWTSSLVTSVARKLLNTIHPALGPFHACSVIRKIRVLVCLAGDHAITSYPLEMLLHSLRPFISDAVTAEDALGISQWLIANGTSHLQQAPSFLAGYAVSTLASLRVFLESSQASTTQESQFKATISKAQVFHVWFVNFLKAYESPAFRDRAQMKAFRSIIHSTSHIRSSGNSEKDTHESNLLLGILKDGEQPHRLLNESARELVLQMLCGDFKMPKSIRNDIMESDAEAFAHGAMVWNSCQAVKSSMEYLTWAGRVVGRSFAASGEIPQDALRESRLLQYRKTTAETGGSEQGLLTLIANLTMADNSSQSGLAESALRYIITEAIASGNGPLLTACRRSMSEPLHLSSNWSDYSTPPTDFLKTNILELDVFGADQIESPSWAKNLAFQLVLSVKDNVILDVLPRILMDVDGFAEQALSFIIHLVLLSQLDRQQTAKRELSEAMKSWLTSTAPATNDNIKLLINTVLYLRTQELPSESSIADRSHWLELDLTTAAAAASRCGMFKVALQFAELAFSDHTRTSRRSSAARIVEDSTEILLGIFENIDDPDAYYGLNQSSSLSNVLARLEYENDGEKSLAFRGSQYDSHRRRRDPAAEHDGQALVKALSSLGHSGLSHSLLQTQQRLEGSAASLDSTFTTARRLEIWNLPVPPTLEHHAVTAYSTYQSIYKAVEVESARTAIHEGLASTMKRLASQSFKASDLRQHLGTLAALTELDDVLGVGGFEELEKALANFEARSKWMMSGRYSDVSQILSCRETTLSMLSQKDVLRTASKLSSAEARSVEIRGMLLSSGIYRYHHATQESLNVSTFLTDLIQPSQAAGLVVDAAVMMEVANSLWDHGEMIPSIRMLQGIDKDASLKKQSIPVSRSDLLSKIGYQISVARLETPDNIQKKYLEPALKELKNKTVGKEAGQVFHQFAMFCDEQLQNPDSLDDLARLRRLQKSRNEEVKHYESLMSQSNSSQLRAKYGKPLENARTWLSLEQQELARAEKTRNEFVKLSLENYLLSLIASDEHNNDALRFTALWLDRSQEDAINESVGRSLRNVPTRKFAPLMNQLSSRLQDSRSSTFQKLLMQLVLSICLEHPYHGMYQIWSGAKARANEKDLVAMSRLKAARRVAEKLNHSSTVGDIWRAIDSTNRAYSLLAVDRDKTKQKTGTSFALKDSKGGRELVSVVAKCPIPPPTLHIELAADKDYKDVPVITKLEPNFSIAGGVNAPKIITVVGSNGEKFKQLVKGGNDDLRQDAIMEQVFAAASSLLKQHRTTRQRDLGIRTYKVLPLTSHTGIIEFVANTIPLHEYLLPAHARYYPQDLRGSTCRKDISEVQHKSLEVRVNTYRKVTDKFHPVMRYFFLESFPDPDDWYVKRLAYTRTTAAISILGHVLGLGDRHGHNILLDRVTGEVVHIDLGIAFEMGRVLPVPEVVPFRMTRDIVDGMGITKTDGVFRRCCEFTLDALREDTYSIMTILDVLRYDPLYSWSISPLRLAKLQGVKTEQDGDSGDEVVERESKKGANANANVNEPSEADRALEVVRKKLSKTLSVTATVNDLINQATDERNLAVLFSGWAAYA